MFRPFIKHTKNAFIFVIKRNAGHSKWQNIRHTKAAKDLERSKIFTRIGQKIRVSIQETGNNKPESNLALAQAIEQAKKNHMPAAAIQNYMKSGQADKDKIKSLFLTVKGPRGCLLLISTLTSNFTKTKSELASVLRRNGGAYDDGARGMFEQKGIIVATPPSDLVNPTEMAVEHAIEAGAEEVKPVEGSDTTLQFTCEVGALTTAKEKLIQFKYTIEESDIIYIAKYAANLADEEMEKVSKLISKIEEYPDVVCVYDNVA